MSQSSEQHRELSTVNITIEQDVVLARRRARQIAAILGFEPQDQSRVATAVSEIARNAFEYGGGGTVDFLLGGGELSHMLLVRVHDSGPGIKELDAVLGGRYQSHTGMGLGISGTRRLTDHFEITSGPGAGSGCRDERSLHPS